MYFRKKSVITVQYQIRSCLDVPAYQ